jgi:predicted nucleotidyltransferase
MALRAVPAGFDPETVAAIDARLDEVSRTHCVSVPLAVESGSRAWGFPSPDSDYDCRFVFVRRLEDYLTPWQKRDVIETPMTGLLDVNGWDLAKALKLLLKGNAVIVEWLCSPIVYRGEAWFRDGFLALARRVADRGLIRRHYLHLGERQRKLHFPDDVAVAQKKIFYALRPAAALRFLRVNQAAAVPPMDFPTLMAECDPPAEVARIAADLIRRKASSRELGTATVPPAVMRFIDAEYEAARGEVTGRAAPATTAAIDEAERFFRDTIWRFAPR